MKFNVGFATDIGRKRQQNQDNGTAQPDLGLFLVADGMGGHRGGETASSMVVETVPVHLKKLMPGVRDIDSAKNAICQSIQAANRAIFDRSQAQRQLEGMGTTATALLFYRDSSRDKGAGGRLVVGHVGDSRCYYYRCDEGRESGFWQLTRDHSLVQEKFRAGLITREEMKTDRMKNVITRSVGFEPNVSVETYEMSVKPGDLLLLCSDGLSGMLDDDAIRAVLDRNVSAGAVQAAVQELIDSANLNGGDDNITAILVQVGNA